LEWYGLDQIQEGKNGKADPGRKKLLFWPLHFPLDNQCLSGKK
jgi:hypothetical protein